MGGLSFPGLKEKLARVSAGGHNNPCAAAAYALKKDFGGAGNLRQRVLVVTAGTAKCAVGEVVKAAEQHGAKDKVGVDVVAFGIGKKGQSAYSNLVKKSNGLLLKVDKPADMDGALARYGNFSKPEKWRRLRSAVREGCSASILTRRSHSLPGLIL